MKYSCCFINAVTGDQRTIVVELRGSATSMALGPT